MAKMKAERGAWRLMKAELKTLYYEYLRNGGCRIIDSELQVTDEDARRWQESEWERDDDPFYDILPFFPGMPDLYRKMPIVYDCSETKFTIRVVRVWCMPTDMIYKELTG